MIFPNLDHEPELIRSFDGTLVAGRRMGAGEGTPLLVANAVGATLAVWRRALVDAARERPIVTWDHRGLHESQIPESDRIDAGAHAEDALAVAGHFGVDRFVMASWSNGARIGLEICSRYPENVAALAVVSGGYGHPIGRAIRNLEPAALLPAIAGVAKHFSSFIQGPFRGLAARAELAGFIRQSGMIGATADTEALVDLLRGMAACDLGRLLSTYEAVSGDPAPELLDEVLAPTLIVAGERDQFTSRATSEEMAKSIPGARLEVYEGATHYLPIEYPARLSIDLRKFWSDFGV
jgi:pimeloyl-ACP methyl ester carboxylesterase